jgi:hypothetical protein
LAIEMRGALWQALRAESEANSVHFARPCGTDSRVFKKRPTRGERNIGEFCNEGMGPLPRTQNGTAVTVWSYDQGAPIRPLQKSLALEEFAVCARETVCVSRHHATNSRDIGGPPPALIAIASYAQRQCS